MDQYQIRIAGHLDQRRARALGCQELSALSGGDSLLAFAALDQAALYGVLTRLRDAGLELVSAVRLTELADRGASTTEPPKEDPHGAEQ